MEEKKIRKNWLPFILAVEQCHICDIMWYIAQVNISGAFLLHVAYLTFQRSCVLKSFLSFTQSVKLSLMLWLIKMKLSSGPAVIFVCVTVY